jgi:CHAT domain-containing protein/Tfp pilus assembly protein PilF
MLMPRTRALLSMLVCLALVGIARGAQTDAGALDEAAALDRRASELYSTGRYAEAIPLGERALAIVEKALGPDHPSAVAFLTDLAVFYDAQAQYAAAEPLLARALVIRERTLGPDHPDVAASLNNLAEHYRAQGQYAKAEPLALRALAIREKALDPDHVDVAESLNNLALVHIAEGQLAKAEPLLVRAAAIFEKRLGPDHPNVATCLNNLAEVYRQQGQYAKAEPLMLRAIAISEKVLGPDHPDLATDLDNLALVYLFQGQAAKAESLAVRAIAIDEKALGPDHPYLARSLDTLAVIYEFQRQFAKAEPFAVRALGIYEKAFGLDSPDVAESLNNVAVIYSAERQFAKAEPMLEQALAIDEKALGPEHPLVAQSLANLAVQHFAMGDLDAAVRFQARADDAREAELRRNLVAGSEQAKREYLQQTGYETEMALSLEAACVPANTAALRMALTQVLRRKGRVLDALVDQLAALARAGAPEDRRLLDELARARAGYASLTLGGPGGKSADQHREELRAAADRVDALEAQAGARSSRVRAELTPITLDAVVAAIPQGATLVEYFVYRPFDPNTTSQAAARYVAFTLAADGTIHSADLGEAGPIDAAVAALREALRANRSGALADVEAEIKPRARTLDALVLAPVRRILGASTRLLVAPDGQLSLVPFDALVDEKGRYVTEGFEISYLTSGRDLLRLAARGESRQPGAVFADPDFGGGAGASEERSLELVEAESQQQTSTPAADLLARAYFPPLPATAAEADALSRLLPGTRVLTGAAASKRELTALTGPRVLHLATHGFFLAGSRPAAIPGRGLELSAAQPHVAAAQADAGDPLLRSGLALAGANLHRGDGILTSLEAAGLDLWGTKLVVLSACDTGVGVVQNGDGVYGLRRAFVLAGSETQVMSLWSVSDTGTRDLMIGYYKRLAAGQGRSAAMRAARLEMLTDPKRSHPFYWASFIVSGEWANLDGKRLQ